MQLLYWSSESGGTSNATIVCKDGHVHLRDIPADARERHEAIVRDLANSMDRLPPTIIEAVEWFDANGLPRNDFNPPHVGFGPQPEGWKPDGKKAVAPKQELSTAETETVNSGSEKVDNADGSEAAKPAPKPAPWKGKGKGK